MMNRINAYSINKKLHHIIVDSIFLFLLVFHFMVVSGLSFSLISPNDLARCYYFTIFTLKVEQIVLILIVN